MGDTPSALKYALDIVARNKAKKEAQDNNSREIKLQLDEIEAQYPSFKVEVYTTSSTGETLCTLRYRHNMVFSARCKEDNITVNNTKKDLEDVIICIAEAVAEYL